MKREPSRGFICPTCKLSLYCIDTRTINSTKDNNFRQRIYCCAECGRRFYSLEVMNPQHYRIKPLPKSFIKQRFEEQPIT